MLDRLLIPVYGKKKSSCSNNYAIQSDNYYLITFYYQIVYRSCCGLRMLSEIADV
jgi:hypothetical protein